MNKDIALIKPHLAGEQPLVETMPDGPVPVDTYAGRIDVEWDPDAAVTPLGQMPFFIDYLKLAGLFDGWITGCPSSTPVRTRHRSAIFPAPCCCRYYPAIGVTLTSPPCEPTLSHRRSSV